MATFIVPFPPKIVRMTSAAPGRSVVKWLDAVRLAVATKGKVRPGEMLPMHGDLAVSMVCRFPLGVEFERKILGLTEMVLNAAQTACILGVGSTIRKLETVFEASSGEGEIVLHVFYW